MDIECMINIVLLLLSVAVLAGAFFMLGYSYGYKDGDK